jgi:hypothetical protein
MEQKLLNHLFNKFGYLLQRWTDESKYENFNLYIDFAKNLVEQQKFVFVSLTKKPFVLTFSDSIKIYTIKYSNKKLICQSIPKPVEPIYNLNII